MVFPGLDIPGLARFLTHNLGIRGQRAAAVRGRVIVLLGSRGVLPVAVMAVLRLKVGTLETLGKMALLAIHGRVAVRAQGQNLRALLEALPVAVGAVAVAL